MAGLIDPSNNLNSPSTSKCLKTTGASLYSTHAAATSLPDQLVSHFESEGRALLPILKVRHQNEQLWKY